MDGTGTEVRLARSSLKIVSFPELAGRGWDAHRLVEELERLDYETMDGLTPDHEGVPSQWAPIWMDHPEMGRLLMEGPEEIVGYWQVVALCEQAYRLARRGRLLDSQITTDKVPSMRTPGRYDMYFMGMCIQSRFRRSAGVRLLFDSFFEQAVTFARKGIFCREMCANAYTPSGARICKSLGMQPVAEHMDRGRIFAVRCYPFPDRDIFRQQTELSRLYASEFG